MLFALIPLAILLIVDFYAFQAFKTITNNKMVFTIYWLVAIATYISFGLALFGNARTWPAAIRLYLGSSLFILFLAKFIITWFLLIDDIVRLGRWATSFFGESAGQPHDSTRLKFLSQLGILAAGIPLAAMLHGMIRNAYNYQIKRVKIKIPNLPTAFQGTTIAQISDIHSGSFIKKEPLVKAVKLINDLKSDFVFFTGDLVNNLASEAKDYVDIFGKIKAKEGVFSVTGNHDYGDYSRWENKADKEQNFEDFKEVHKSMGWNLLLNDHQVIEKDGEKLAIIGVENWSANPRFRRYGDLKKAYQGCEDCSVKLLLSHDPSHWRAEVLKAYPDINAMFSGHTHGFQFGINLPFFKWSPIKYAYDEWIGLYKEGHQHLYVNPGFGYVGYPGRVGFLPEITVFELEKA